MKRLPLKLPAPGTVVFTIPGRQMEAEVVERPNRFMVLVRLDGELKSCHLHDPGRLGELIFKGNQVLIRKTKGRKTEYSITAALRGSHWILIDSRFHNKVASSFLPWPCTPEFRIGRSRLDFRCDDFLVEVKGSTLCPDSTALFPDAPSVRASHHAALLAENARGGRGSLLLFLVFSPEAMRFAPNLRTDPEFHNNFWETVNTGTDVRVLKIILCGNDLIYYGEIPYTSGSREKDHFED